MIHKSLRKLTFLLLILGLISIESCQKEDDVDFYSENYIGPGSDAADYLRDEEYTSLEIEAIYEPGVQPDSGAIDGLIDFLNEYLNKPDGITITLREIDDQGENSLRLNEIEKIEEEYRTNFNSGNKLSTYIYFANSKNSSDDRKSRNLGLAYGATSMIIFQETIRENSEGDEEIAARFEESILKHEFGHLLGLVDVGSRPVNPHEDPENPHHCDATQCLMYHAIEVGGEELNISLTFDDNCLADLRANGSK